MKDLALKIYKKRWIVIVLVLISLFTLYISPKKFTLSEIYEALDIGGAATITWDGGGADNNWSTCANWSTDTCPTSVDAVVFNSTSTKDSTVDAGFTGTVTSFNINNGYSGTVTLQRNLTVNGAYSQTWGTFSGGAHTLSVGTNFSSWATFNAPSILNIGSSSASNVSFQFSIVFSHNNGVINFIGSSSVQVNACNNVVFNQVNITGTGTVSFNQSTCTIPLGNNPTVTATINGNMGVISGSGTLTFASGKSLTLSGGSLSGFTGLVSPGGVNIAGGTLNLSSYSTVDIDGDLTISSGAVTASGGNMTIGGILNFSGGTFTHNSGTITFDSPGTISNTLSCNNQVLNQVNFSTSRRIGSNCNIPVGNNATVPALNIEGTLSGTGTLTATGKITFYGAGTFSGFGSFSGTSMEVTANGNPDLSSLTSFTLTNFSSINSGTWSLPNSGNVTLESLNVNGGTFNVGNIGATFTNSLTIAGGTFNGGSGDIDANSSVMMTSGSFTSTSGTLYVGGFTFSLSGTFTHNSGTIVFDGSSATITCNGAVFNNVVLNNSSSTTINSNCNIPLGNNASITGSFLTLSGTLSGSGSLSVAPRLTMNTGAAFSGFTGTLNVANQMIANGGTLESGFTGLIVSSGLTVAGATLDLGTYTSVDLNSPSDPGFNMSSGIFTAPSSGSMTVEDDFIFSGGTFNANGGTITIDGNGNNATITCGAITFNKVAFNHSGNYRTISNGCNLPLGNNPTIPESVTVAGTLTGSGTLTMNKNTSSSNVIFNSTGALSGFSSFSSNTSVIINSGATLNFSSYSLVNVGGTLVVHGDVTTSNTSTILNNLSGNGTITGGTGGTVQITTTGTFYPPEITNFGNLASLEIDGNLSIQGSNLTLPSGTTTIAGSIDLGTSGFGGSFAHNNGTLAIEASDITLNCDSSSKHPLNNVTIINSGNKTFQYCSALNLGNNTSITSNVTLWDSYATAAGTLTINGNLTARSSPGTNQLSGITNLVINGNLNITNSGDVNLSSATSADINGNFFLNFTGGETFRAPATVSVSGDFYAGSAVGNSNSGFIHSSGIVILDGNNQTIYDQSNQDSEIKFHKLRKNVTSAATLSFEAGSTVIIENEMEFNGAIGNRLSLRSTIPGTQWKIDPQLTRTISNLDVQDSENINAIDVEAGNTNSVDSGNNIKWNFTNANNAPAITGLGPTNLTDGSTTTDTTPTFTFTISDSEGDQVNYRIQIDNNSDFSSPEVDYTSALAAAGNLSFTIGQELSSGTYSSGSVGQTLIDGSYYVRVMSTDSNSESSSYTVANSGSIAFVLSTSSNNGGNNNGNGNNNDNDNNNNNDNNSNSGTIDISSPTVETDPNDEDEDGLTKEFEEENSGNQGSNNELDPKKNDSNDNGISDGNEDFDNDGLNNKEEQKNNTDPNDADTDNDGILDGEEVQGCKFKKTSQQEKHECSEETFPTTDPTQPDSDTDTLPDGFEIDNSGPEEADNELDPTETDTDKDTITDPKEDFDNDGLNNRDEYENTTNPNKKDSDDDGAADGEEVKGCLFTDGTTTCSGTVYTPTDPNDNGSVYNPENIKEENNFSLAPGTVLKVISTASDNGDLAKLLFTLTAATLFLDAITYPKAIRYGFLWFRRRKRTPWGIVYNSDTLKTIPFATVRLFDNNGNFITQQISDMDGKYSIVADKGEYVVRVNINNYLEYSKTVTVGEELVTLDIALSPEVESFNLVRFIQKGIKNNIGKVNGVIFYLGLIISLLALLFSPILINIFIVVLFIIQIIAYYSIRKNKAGKVFDTLTQKGVHGIFVRVFNDEKHQVDVSITDDRGRFNIILKEGEYLVKIESHSYKLSNIANKTSDQFGNDFLKINTDEEQRLDIEIPLQRINAITSKNETRFGMLGGKYSV